MPFSKKIKTECGILGLWDLTDSTDFLLEDFEFADNEKTEFSRISLDRRKLEYLSVRMLLKELLGEKTLIHYSKTGKPFIKNKGVNISISHCSGLAAIMISESNIGLDVENTDRDLTRIQENLKEHSPGKTKTKNLCCGTFITKTM